MSRLRQAVILAGGKGTRLASRLGGAPKPLVDVLGKPLLERQIEQLKAAGIERLILLVNHRAEQIADFCADRANFGIDIELVDDGEPRGTAGATLAVLDRLEDDVLIVYGDTLFDVDLGRFADFHARDAGALATLFLHPNDHPADSDLVELDDAGAVRAFHASPHPPGAWLPNMVNAALYALRREALTVGAAAFAAGGQVDFARQLFPHLIGLDGRLRGYVSPEYIKDVGTPARLDRACGDLASGKVAASSLRHRQTAVFLDRDGTLNVPNGHIARPEDLQLFPFAGEAVRLLNASSHRVVLATNQPVVARGDCTAEGLATIHAKLETQLGETGAFVERIYVCPHHPDRGFAGEVVDLKIHCDCRKPKPGLLLRARDDLNIDLSRSWFIGDSQADVDAARACGVTPVLVRTGDPAKIERLRDQPEHVFDDVLAAARFIVSRTDDQAAHVGPAPAETA